MQNITCTGDLKYAIQLLEEDRAIKGQMLKEQFFLTYSIVKPSNLIAETLSGLSTSPTLLGNVMGSLMGLLTAYVSKRIFGGVSVNIIRKFLAPLLRLGVTNGFARHPDALKSFGRYIFQHIFHKKKKLNSVHSD